MPAVSDLPPPTPDTAHDAGSAPTNDGDTPRRRQRFVVIAVAVVVVAVLSAGLIALVGGDDGDDAGTDIEPWDAIVATQPDSGEVTIYDTDGDEIQTIDTGFGTVGAVAARGEYALVHESDGEAAVIIDTAGGEITWRGEPSFDNSQIRWLYGTLEPIAADGSLEGGDIVIVDAATGQEIDVDELAGIDEPMFLPSGIGVLPGARYVTANEMRGSEVAIVGLTDGGGTSVEGLTRSFHRDGVLVVTSGLDDDDDELSFVRADESLDVQPGPDIAMVAGARLTDHETAIVLTREGQLLRAVAGDTEPTEVAEIDLGEDAIIATAFSPLPVDRFMAMTSGGADVVEETIIIDLDGNELTRVEGTPRVLRGYSARCVMVDGGDRGRIIDFETGEELGSVPSDVSLTVHLTSGDGCTVGFPGDSREQTTIIGPSGEITLDGQVTRLADGSAAIVRGEDRSLEMVDVEEPDSDPVVIDAAAADFVTR